MSKLKLIGRHYAILHLASQTPLVNRYGHMAQGYTAMLQELVAAGYLECDGDFYRITEKGRKKLGVMPR
jgi:predicted transcriptional regulator